MTELESKVLELINEITECKYIGKLKVTNDDTCYFLHLYLDREFTPIILGYEGTVDEFLNFVKDEIKSRKLEKVGFYKLVREPIPNEFFETELENE